MTTFVECPRCSGTQITREARYRNARNGDSMGRWLPGCTLQLVIVSLLLAAGGFAARFYWPTHSFAEAALLTATIALIYAIGVGIFGLWVRSWPLVDKLNCDTCGYWWYVDDTSKQRGRHMLDAEKPTG